MNKADFISYVSEQHLITKAEAKKVIDMFTSSVISAISEKKEISLMGFGSFSIHPMPPQKGRNPKTGKPVSIPAYNRVHFKVGQKMKNAVNS
jgi:DNA-binding protein HU-beta